MVPVILFCRNTEHDVTLTQPRRLIYHRLMRDVLTSPSLAQLKDLSGCDGCGMLLARRFVPLLKDAVDGGSGGPLKKGGAPGGGGGAPGGGGGGGGAGVEKARGGGGGGKLAIAGRGGGGGATGPPGGAGGGGKPPFYRWIKKINNK